MIRNGIATLLVFATSMTYGQEAATGEQICGPRCVEYILNAYDRPTELTDLIYAMQGGQADRMVSAAMIAKTLENKGIHTRILKLDPPSIPDWPHPTVLHLINASGSGHFVISVPGDAGHAVMFWDGGTFHEELPEPQRNGLTGVVVLTSPEPFAQDQPPELGIRTTESSSTLNWVGGGLLGAVGMVLIGWFLIRR